MTTRIIHDVHDQINTYIETTQNTSNVTARRVRRLTTGTESQIERNIIRVSRDVYKDDRGAGNADKRQEFIWAHINKKRLFAPKKSMKRLFDFYFKTLYPGGTIISPFFI